MLIARYPREDIGARVPQMAARRCRLALYTRGDASAHAPLWLECPGNGNQSLVLRWFCRLSWHETTLIQLRTHPFASVTGASPPPAANVSRCTGRSGSLLSGQSCICHILAEHAMQPGERRRCVLQDRQAAPPPSGHRCLRAASEHAALPAVFPWYAVGLFRPAGPRARERFCAGSWAQRRHPVSPPAP
jgi:hypothetical protein